LTLTLTPLSPFPLVHACDPLDELILHALKLNGMTLEDGDILVLAQKIVSKSEGRLVDLETVQPSSRAIDLVEKIEKDPRMIELILRRAIASYARAQARLSWNIAWVMCAPTPARNGTVGVTIGLAGLPGIVDKRGQPDLFSYQLRVTQIAAADELAAGASLVMGQTAEGTPVIHVRGFPYQLREGSGQELIRDKQMDLFR